MEEVCLPVRITSVLATKTQVTLQQPALAKVSEAAEAINDEMLVDFALDMFGEDRGAGDGVASKASTTAPRAVKSGVVGVAKGPTKHLVRLNPKATGNRSLCLLEVVVFLHTGLLSQRLLYLLAAGW